MMKLGPTRYYVDADYGLDGFGHPGEGLTEEGKVTDALLEFLKDEDRDFRVTRVDYHSETDMPEHPTDETEHFRKLVEEAKADAEDEADLFIVPINDHYAQERHGWEQV